MSSPSSTIATPYHSSICSESVPLHLNHTNQTNGRMRQVSILPNESTRSATDTSILSSSFDAISATPSLTFQFTFYSWTSSTKLALLHKCDQVLMCKLFSQESISINFRCHKLLHIKLHRSWISVVQRQTTSQHAAKSWAALFVKLLVYMQNILIQYI